MKIRIQSLKFTFIYIVFSTIVFSCKPTENSTVQKPNIVIVYVDDLGYGDVGCYGAVGVETPNIDKLAANGMRFTDAHCSASTCTPSRYAMLTGRYAFRVNAAVLKGDAPLLIDTKLTTLPGMLQKAGYKTGIVGKWHLGLGDGNLNWNDSIKPGPIETGFDYCFLVPATGDRVPTVYVENHHVIGLDPNDPLEVSFAEMVGNEPTGMSNPEMLKQLADPQHSNTIVNGVSRIGYQSGGESAHWVDEEFPDVLAGKAKEFITTHKDEPFFLFYSFHDIHVPRIPNERFVGSSSMGPRGDVIAQMDWCTGEVIQKLEELGLAENTLIIFSSDNGPVMNDGYEDQCVELLGDHKPAGPLRGGKYSSFEAGTRVPTIVYWPGKVQAGESEALLTQVDLYASLAELVGQEIVEGSAEDSESYLDAWLGKSMQGREYFIEEAYVKGLRHGNWKYIPPTDKKETWIKNQKKIESGWSADAQLYNLETDINEQVNLANENPEKVKEMDAMLKQIEESN